MRLYVYKLEVGILMLEIVGWGLSGIPPCPSGRSQGCCPTRTAGVSLQGRCHLLALITDGVLTDIIIIFNEINFMTLRISQWMIVHVVGIVKCGQHPSPRHKIDRAFRYQYTLYLLL